MISNFYCQFAKTQNLHKGQPNGLNGLKAPAAKPEDLNSIPGTHMVERINRLPKIVP